MKNNYRFFPSRWLSLWICICLASHTLALPAAAQLAIFHVSPSAQPGDAVSLQGSFGATAQVHLSSSAGAQTLPALLQSEGQVTVQIPSSLSLGLYQLWVEQGGKSSARVLVNQARGLHFDSPEVAPGDTLHLYGRNLQMPGGNTQVSIGNYPVTDLIASKSDAYTLTLKVPASLPLGQYTVTVSNGYDSPTPVEQPLTTIAAGQDYFKLGVPWAAKFTPALTSNVYNVKTDYRLSKHAAGDTSSTHPNDDLLALREAIQKAHADIGGGIVYLPAGTYKLVYELSKGEYRGLELPSNVVLLGDGPESTHIVYGYGDRLTGSGGWGILISPNASCVGISNLSLVNVNERGNWHKNVVAFGFVSNVFLHKVHATFSGEAFNFSNGVNRMLMKDCHLTSTYSSNFTGDEYSQGSLTLAKAKNVVLRGNTFQHEVF